MISTSTPAGSSPASAARSQRGFGVSGAREHAARLRGEREDVARLHDVVGPRVRRARRCGSCARDRSAEMPVVTPVAASIDTVKFVWCGDVLRSTIGFRPSWRQCACVSGRQTRPRPSRTMKLMSSGAHFFGGHDQVAFVLAILVVEDHDHAAGADLGEDFGNRRKAHALRLAIARTLRST